VIYAYNIRITYISVAMLSIRSEIPCHVILRLDSSCFLKQHNHLECVFCDSTVIRNTTIQLIKY
jgi:hypothetical protein